VTSAVPAAELRPLGAASKPRAIRLGVGLAVLALALVVQLGEAPIPCETRGDASARFSVDPATGGADCPAPSSNGAPVTRIFGGARQPASSYSRVVRLAF
jgi:hypothetical protein